MKDRLLLWMLITACTVSFLLGQTFTFYGEVDFFNADIHMDEVDNGNSGASATIDWTTGNKQAITLTAATVTLTFTDPNGDAGLRLYVIQDPSGSRAVTWDADVDWPGATPPALSAGANDVDYIGCDYRVATATYYCTSLLDFG